MFQSEYLERQTLQVSQENHFLVIGGEALDGLRQGNLAFASGENLTGRLVGTGGVVKKAL